MILSIDTSSPNAHVALHHSGSFYGATSKDSFSHCESLNSLLKEVLYEAKADLSLLKTILIGAGPGSFTGLRIGYSFALGLKDASSAKIYSISTFQAYGNYEHKTQKNRLVCSDARREEVFFNIYKPKNAEPVYEDIFIIKKDAIEAEIEKNNFEAIDIDYFDIDGCLNKKTKTFVSSNIALDLISFYLKYSTKDFNFENPKYTRKVQALKLSDRKNKEKSC